LVPPPSFLSLGGPTRNRPLDFYPSSAAPAVQKTIVRGRQPPSPPGLLNVSFDPFPSFLRFRTPSLPFVRCLQYEKNPHIRILSFTNRRTFAVAPPSILVGSLSAVSFSPDCSFPARVNVFTRSAAGARSPPLQFFFPPFPRANEFFSLTPTTHPPPPKKPNPPPPPPPPKNPQQLASMVSFPPLSFASLAILQNAACLCTPCSTPPLPLHVAPITAFVPPPD